MAKMLTVKTPVTLVTSLNKIKEQETLQILQAIIGNDPHFHAASAKEILGWHINNPHINGRGPTRLGRIIDGLLENAGKDYLLPNKIIVNAAIEYLKGLEMTGVVRHVFLVQIPHAPGQATLLAQRLERNQLAHIEADCSADRLNKRQKSTLMAVDRFEKMYGDILTFPKGYSTEERILQLLNFAEIPKDVQENWLESCRDKAHPAHRLINPELCNGIYFRKQPTSPLANTPLGQLIRMELKLPATKTAAA